MILCILKGILPFKMHKIIFLPEKLIKFKVSPVNLIRVCLPETQVFLAHLSHWLMVSYCDHWMSVMPCQPLLQRTSPPKLLAVF